MDDSLPYLTRDEGQSATQAVCLFTRPLPNLCEIVAQFAGVIVRGAIDRGQDRLTYDLKVVTGLATLQSAVQDLSRAYLAHTNTILGKGPGASLELLNVSNSLAIEHGLIPSGRLATPAPPPAPEQAEVKKRKRAPHDKNAPKRPVTPYFLYMSFAREGIARDMGPAAPAKQVADEGTRRWNSMDQEEKQVIPSRQRRRLEAP